MKPMKITKDLKQVNFRKSIKIRLKPINDGFRIYYDRYINGKRSYTFTDFTIIGTAVSYSDDLKILDAATLERDKMSIRDSITQEEKQVDQLEIKFSLFVETFKDDPKHAKGKSKESYESALKHWEKFCIVNNLTELKIKDLRKKHFEDFIYYLSKRVKNSSTNLYIRKLKTIIKHMVDNKILEENPMKGVKKQDEEDAERVYLLAEELTKLKNNPTENNEIMAAFFFQVNTGLRYSDMAELTFDKIERDSVPIKQIKTKEPLKVDFNTEAKAIIMRQRGKHGSIGKVFKIPPHLWSYNYLLKKWAKLAGINKDLSSHVARHSAATILILAGVDIFTVSKILGHTDIKTTQKYLHLVDEVKREAMDKIQY